jgi:outer membrane protein assembly factor BamE
MRPILLSILVLSLSACSIVYKLPTRQGNVIEQKQLDQLQLGMSKDQVKFLLGTPIASDPFRQGRWDYLGYYKSPRGKVSSRTVTLWFDDNKLSKMDGVQLAAADAAAVGTPDTDTLAKQVIKDQNDKSRNLGKDKTDSGVTIK